MVDQTDKITSIHPDNDEPVNNSWAGALPVKQGLYDPELEKDACGVGFAWYFFLLPSVAGANFRQSHQGQGQS